MFMCLWYTVISGIDSSPGKQQMLKLLYQFVSYLTRVADKRIFVSFQDLHTRTSPQLLQSTVVWAPQMKCIPVLPSLKILHENLSETWRQLQVALRTHWWWIAEEKIKETFFLYKVQFRVYAKSQTNIYWLCKELLFALCGFLGFGFCLLSAVDITAPTVPSNTRLAVYCALGPSCFTLP